MCLASFPNSQVSNHMTVAQSFNGPVSGHISVSLFPDSPVRLCLCRIALLYVVSDSNGSQCEDDGLLEYMLFRCILLQGK